MVKCYFNNNFDNLLDCDYSINNNIINITVYGNNAPYTLESLFKDEFAKQFLYYAKTYKITILDYKNRKFYKLYNAIHTGIDVKEDNTANNFKADTYLFTQKLDKIKEVDDNPNITSIKLYNEFFQYLFPIECLSQKRNEDFYEVRVEKKLHPKVIDINNNNVKRLLLLDEYSIKKTHGDSISININMCKCCKIVLNTPTKFSRVNTYINDFDAYINLIFNERKRSHRVLLEINNEYFELTYRNQFSCSTKNSSLPIIEEDYSEFIKRCYSLLPFDKQSDYKCNVKIISLYNDYKNMEDVFMSYYRFIEFYYKSNGENHFIEHIVNKYKYIFEDYFTSTEITENFPFEIISLRNHYAHTGYYIKDNMLKVKKYGKFLYSKNIDTLWIGKLMKCLKKVFYKIVLSEILGYDEVNLFLLN